MTAPRTGSALFYGGGTALAVLAFVVFLLAARFALRPLRRFGWTAHVLPPRLPGCLLAGLVWVLAVATCSTAGLEGRMLAAASLWPGDLLVGPTASVLGVDELRYGTWLEGAILLVDVVLYGLLCYALCRIWRWGSARGG